MEEGKFFDAAASRCQPLQIKFSQLPFFYVWALHLLQEHVLLLCGGVRAIGVTGGWDDCSVMTILDEGSSLTHSPLPREARISCANCHEKTWPAPFKQ